jgi:hypothetical protein
MEHATSTIRVKHNVCEMHRLPATALFHIKEQEKIKIETETSTTYLYCTDPLQQLLGYGR